MKVCEPQFYLLRSNGTYRADVSL